MYSDPSLVFNLNAVSESTIFFLIDFKENLEGNSKEEVEIQKGGIKEIQF